MMSIYCMGNKDQGASTLDTTEGKMPRYSSLEHLRKFCLKWVATGNSPVGFLPSHHANKNVTTKTVDTKKKWTIYQVGWACTEERREANILTIWGLEFCGSKVENVDFVGLTPAMRSSCFCVGLYLMFAKNIKVWDVRFCFMSIYYEGSKANQSINPVADV